MTLDFPIDAARLAPQRPPMLMVSRLLSADESGGCVEAEIGAGNPFLRRDLTLPPEAILEIMAQSIACWVGWNDLRQARDPGIGYLLGTRSLNLDFPPMRLGDALQIEVRSGFVDSDIASFECQVWREKISLGSSRLTVFRPKTPAI
ncbi:MAG: hypothetical protein RL095_3987 [Verrucomicrobiota bacterium]|jgi:predicted hotdog family 3-hydroxylacyl-ACP dehydratase